MDREYSPDLLEKYLQPMLVAGVSADEIKNFLRSDLPIAFIVTKNYQIYIGSLYHYIIRERQNLTQNDELMIGMFEKYGAIRFPDKVSSDSQELKMSDITEIQNIVKIKVTSFLKSL